MEEHFGDAIGGVHLLPFFPSSHDRGFAPEFYDEVETPFGDWEDVLRLGVRDIILCLILWLIIFLVNPSIIRTIKKHEASVNKAIFLKTGISFGQKTVRHTEM